MISSGRPRDAAASINARVRRYTSVAGENGASRTRTGDLLGAIQALSQLSYSPARRQLPLGCGTV
jgi:hypothetical protein